MPPKLPSRERAWGTRYDSLGPSPPISPQKPAFPTPASTPISRPASADINTTDVPDQEPSIPQTRAIQHQQEKMPHDASVFVGSLPSTVDTSELTRLLREHLSQYTEVKGVKVVRDPSKNGTCAFVQCQSAAAAADLIDTLRSLPHRPFLGRMLRYEPARATRALLISFRQPAQPLDVSGGQNTTQHISHEAYGTDALPTAMRIKRSSNSKFLDVVYDDEARHYSSSLSPLLQPHDTGSSRLGDAGVFLDPLKYNAEDIRKIALAFGPIEHFVAFVPNASESSQGGVHTDSRGLFPRPHDEPRSASMDQNVWEVKWEHRNDCVNALMTLRRVSFLNVSWAHHAEPPFTNSTYASNPSHALNVRTTFSGRFHAQIQQHPIGSPTLSPHEQPPVAGESCLRSDPTKLAHTMRVSPAPPADVMPCARPWPLTSNPTPSDAQFESMPATLLYGDRTDNMNSTKWSDTDFPPLNIPERDSPARNRAETSRISWSGSRLPAGGHSVSGGSTILASPASSLSVNPSTTPVRSRSHSGTLAATETSPLSQSDPVTTTEAHTERTATRSPVPPSPRHYAVPRTPKSGRFPPSPSVHPGEADLMHFPGHEGGLQRTFERMKPCSEPASLVVHGEHWLAGDKHLVDPTAIFVGGLDVYSDDVWDESHLGAIFAQYGQIEGIQVVRPASKKSAFAFIKFSDAEAAAKAVREEHNSVHNGRQIRVQLRDHNPRQRTPWGQPLSRASLSTLGPNRSPLRIDGRRGVPEFCDGSSVTRSPSSKLSAGFAHREHSEPDIKTRRAFTSPHRLNASNEREGEEGPRKSSRVGDQALDTPLSSTRRVSLPASSIPYDHQLPYVSSATPAPSVSSVGPSASVTGAVPPYAIPYFAPPWVHAYPPPYPYPIPFVPFPAYAAAMPPSHPQQSHHDSPTEAPGPMTSQQAWPPGSEVQRPMVPYMPYPPVPPYGDQTQTHSAQLNHSHPDHQPPLRPTGFIQGQHGMLIPVYQPEALQQYMSNTEQAPSPSHAQVPAHPPHPPTWPQPSQYPFVPYPMPMPPTGLSPSQPPPYSQKAWMPGPASQDTPPHGAPFYHQGPLLLPPSASLSSMSSFNGTYPTPFPAPLRHMHRNTGNLSPRRFHRRDVQANPLRS
ncbi:hypothetical protein DAEQUDRAFT_807262 [Daedalea quercina L-15889]|uniref:RRM domain-containing protein n=1 Tax=Daedalea quercina L-15889 TaxID=1314783 RepID=A0A165UJ85_9APHY|nr:hypothetical protein DAEQUDRAFT_807262 [Daedalea quercina L-15889]